jgi:hypothetical protein
MESKRHTTSHSYILRVLQGMGCSAWEMYGAIANFKSGLQAGLRESMHGPGRFDLPWQNVLLF